MLAKIVPSTMAKRSPFHKSILSNFIVEAIATPKIATLKSSRSKTQTYSHI
ncbi:hypothetical protein [Trichodesmium erythraeum]|uniref:hypothetical protein n=1 Tax=Trichodesmium erythraeum TaxID=1206 RepID=UPI0018C8C503